MFKSNSPDYEHLAELEYITEIAMGVALHSLTIDGYKVKSKHGFFDLYIWSEDSKYFAITEYMYEEASARDRFRFLVFNLNEKKYGELKTNSFVYPLKRLYFEEEAIVLIKEDPGKAIKYTFDKIKNWRKYGYQVSLS